jgi:hypothetical protein
MIVLSGQSGKITSIVNGCDDSIDKYEGGIICPDADINWNTHYILNGQPTERPASPVTRTDLTLFDVPNGATLWINGVSYGAEGEVELEFPLPGSYSLRVECWPYKDWEGEVVVPVVSGVES